MMRRILINLPYLAALPTNAEKENMKQSGDPQAQFMAQASDLLKDFDWVWLFYFLTAAVLVFGIILFSVLFIRRWQVPRLGFFIYTAGVFVIRVIRPTDRAWIAAAVAGAVFSLVLLFYIHKGAHNVNRKEPIYYLLNTFSLGLIAFSDNYFFYAVAAMSLFASLFFITTINPTAPNKYNKRNADPYILESLEKRARRRL